MTQLEPCPGCHRHVKVDETACPFCAQSLVEAFAAITPRALPRTRLGRAATFAFGGAVALSPAACGDNEVRPDAAKHIDAPKHVDAAIDAPPDAPPDAEIDAGGVPIYAAAPTKDDPTTDHG